MLISKRVVLYRTPGMDAVTIRRDVEYRATGAGSLLMDVYYPPDSQTGARTPAVVFVTGFRDPGMRRALGCNFKEMGSATSWARLVAASGLVAITYTNTEPEADAYALIQHVRQDAASLGVDENRMGVWACSGHVPVALSVLMQRQEFMKCAVLYYGYMLDLEGSTTVVDAAKRVGFVNPCVGKSVADLPQDLPLFIARGGQDEMPGLNEALDRFLARALARNLPVAFANHRTGPHAFDLSQDGEATRAIIRQTLAFLRSHLLG
jgi:hypothetical protein